MSNLEGVEVSESDVKNLSREELERELEVHGLAPWELASKPESVLADLLEVLERHELEEIRNAEVGLREMQDFRERMNELVTTDALANRLDRRKELFDALLDAVIRGARAIDPAKSAEGMWG